MSVYVDCDCGRKFKFRDEQLGKIVKCPFCGKGHRVSLPASHEDEEAIDKQQQVPQRKSREPLLWIGFAVGILTLAALSIALIDRAQRANADRNVAEKVTEATALISENHPEEAISLLETTLTTPNASDLSSANQLLEKAHAAKASLEDTRLIEKAERLMIAGDIEAAVRSLTGRVPAMRDTNKSRAAAIVENVRRASSEDDIIRDLSTLSDNEVTDTIAVESLISRFETKYESVRGIYRRNVQAKISAERTRREEVKRKAEAERLARVEEERLKRLEEEKVAKDAEAKRAAEEAKIAEERKAKEAEHIAKEERRKRSFKGFGQEATRNFSLSEGLAVVKLKHRGSANFIVSLLNDAGDGVQSFANLIGSCSISRAVRIPRDGDYVLNIKADGDWEITIAQPLPRETEFGFFFEGDETSATRQFKLLDGLCRIKLKHRGDSNFIVTLLDEEGRPVGGIVNVIGNYEGSQAVKIKSTGTYIFDVRAGGPWSIELE